MSRSRWAVLLGPPLLIVLAGGAVAADAGRAIQPGATSTAAPGTLGACITAAVRPAGQSPRPERSRPGAWWRVTPTLDGAGALVGWTLNAGAPDEPAYYPLELPAESTASGPVGEIVVVAVEDGGRSMLRVIDLEAGCVRDVAVGDAIARLAISDPVGSGFLVHLIARGTRTDLGIWHVDEAGQRTPVIGPVDAAALATAGIRRVWATNLAAAADGRVAIQSCDPDACLTRLLDRRSGRVAILAGNQGDLVGFARDGLVTSDACGGPTCGITTWTADGRSRALAAAARGAAITADGRTVVVAGADGTHPSTVAIDVSTGTSRQLDSVDPEAVLLGASARSAGTDAGPEGVGVLRPDGPPLILEVRP